MSQPVRRRYVGGKKREYHGLSRTRAYMSWFEMHRRCRAKSGKHLKDYVNRKIAVCERWAKFAHFFADMGERPKGYVLDRKNNSRGYYRRNCRWVSPKESSRNTRRNRLLTLNGRTLCVSAWSEELNISISTIRTRLRKGQSVRLALTTPIGPTTH
jgi:hypothetical protein